MTPLCYHFVWWIEFLSQQKTSSEWSLCMYVINCIICQESWLSQVPTTPNRWCLRRASCGDAHTGGGDERYLHWLWWGFMPGNHIALKTESSYDAKFVINGSISGYHYYTVCTCCDDKEGTGHHHGYRCHGNAPKLRYIWVNYSGLIIALLKGLVRYCQPI